MKETRIDRYIRQFAALGPDSPVMTATDNIAMDAFTGMSLYLDETLGSGPLTKAMKLMTNPAYSGQNGFYSPSSRKRVFNRAWPSRW